MPESSLPDVPLTVRQTAETLERLRHATLGEYEIQGELGQGGMAAVFLAHDIALDRKVAIKVMHPAMILGQGMVDRFRREARTAASLSHPNIIPVYAVREAESLLFFVMKLVQGTPLDAVMQELGPLPLPMIEAIVGQVGSALGYAHRKGVIHRDVKPANILIDEEGWAVVTDFGIAKVAETEGLTLTGMAVGTPTYMSPEQALGTQITGASDQYSLGVVAYEMLAGRPPFTGGNAMSMMYAHCHETPPPLVEQRPDCSDHLREAVERMMAKEPGARWATMEDTLNAVGLRVLAPDDPNRSQLVQLARTGALRRLTPKVQTPHSPIPLGRTPREAPAVAPAPRGPRHRAWLGAAGVLALAGAGWLLLPDPGPAGTSPVTSSAESRSDSGGGNPASVGAVPGANLPAAPAPADPAPPRSERAGHTRAAVPHAPAADPRDDAGRPARADRESVATREASAASRPVDTVRRVDPPAPSPVPPSVASVTRSEVSMPPPNQPAAPPSERLEIEQAIQSYARALEAGDMAQALRLFPTMPAELRQGLDAFYRSGSTMRPQWTVTDVVPSGLTATARIQGTNLVRSARDAATTERVNLRARLERTAAGWRLIALVN